VSKAQRRSPRFSTEFRLGAAPAPGRRAGNPVDGFRPKRTDYRDGSFVRIRLYVAAESGEVSVFQESGKTLVFKGQMKMPHAHTVSVDPQTHLVYFPLQNVDGHPVLRIMIPVQK
jgi:hypothetical protein